MGLWCFLAIWGTGINENEMANGLDQLVNQPAFSDALWGILVYDPLRDEVLYNLNADKNFRPASNQKIITTVLAFDRLGPDFRFETRLYCDGPIVDGTLYGNLWV
ncbi:MAG: D-alanyl-D-alanine carboxypeptidase, partial [Acidobacteria bacterium]|nr:D-alanyl-D-alanine carboxypeptidase [Acidobacteriota bacterium]